MNIRVCGDALRVMASKNKNITMALADGAPSGLQVKDQNEVVSLQQALDDLNKAKDLLKSFKDKNERWQNPLELLDITAAALDEAGLALRHIDDNEQDEEEIMKVLLVQQLAESVSRGRLAILEGTHGVVSGKRPDEIADSKKTLIVWATHTGNSKRLALQLKGHMDGIAMNIKDLRLADLQGRKRVLFICSTFGFGRPPRDAEVFFSTLQVLGGKEGSITVLFGLEFAIAALGNSKFSGTFAQFGKDISERMKALGAKEIIPLAILDVMDGKNGQRKAFGEWQNKVLELEGRPPVIIEEGSSGWFSVGGSSRSVVAIKETSSNDQARSCCNIL